MREEPVKVFSEREKLDRLRLIRSPHVGPVTFHQLLKRCGSGSAALAALPELARRGGRRSAQKICSRASAEKEVAAHQALGGELIFFGEAAYPPRLAVIVDAPPVLSVIGHIPLLTKKAIGIVGARNASSNGCAFAEKIAADLGRHGYLIVSGMARGIDAAAHLGGLETGTVAVLGCGVDIAYPKQNAKLYDAERERAALITELAPGTRPAARQFPRRNRIISGMVRGVVIVEASPRSGSLITARLAADQGREVFAVPGAAQDPRGRGTNGLIRDGAVLTETADDVLAVLDHMPQATHPPRPAPITSSPCEAVSDSEPPTDSRAIIVAALGPTPTPMDELIRRCGIPPAIVATILMELELAGRLERHPGNMISLLAEI